MFSGLFNALAATLNFFYSLVPNYGIAILMLTLSVMIILTPLTLRGTRSMMKMQQLQPEMKKIQAKYKDDRQKLNEELLAFYRENKINPVGGCLPLLIQMPVFFVLYRVIWGLTHEAGKAGFEPKDLDNSSDLYKALYHQHEMVSFGMDLSQSATKAMSESFVHAVPFLILVALVIVTGYIQQKQVSGRTPQAQVNPQQQMMLKVMPAFIGFISLNIPAGVVLYFLGSNLYRIAQQAYISKTMYADAKKGVIDTSAKERKPEAPAKPRPKRSAEVASETSPATTKPASRPARPGAGRSGRFGQGTNGSNRNGTGTSAPEDADAVPDKPAAPQPRARKKKKRK
jgi:YidC/Oxa1 family membrane protein insertase